jgi:NADPH:quinone reductase-like Zn-dependent oxidoreductase
MKLVESRMPVVADHQVLVRVRAVSLNRGDLDLLKPGTKIGRPGFVVGTDAAGDVVAVGRNVTGIRTGTRVTSTYFRNWVDGPLSAKIQSEIHGRTLDGVLANFVALDETAIVPFPDVLSYEQAATLPTAAVTAWMATIGKQELRKGDVVLVQGTGGVSVFALQFASAAGARVLVTSSSDDKLRRLHKTLPLEGINYQTAPKWSERVLALTNGHGADLVVDVGGKSTLEESVNSLAYGGRLSIVGGLTGYDGQVSSSDLLMKTARADGVYLGSVADFRRMNDFIAAHRLQPVIDRVFDLQHFEEAFKALQDGQFVGKIVIRL